MKQVIILLSACLISMYCQGQDLKDIITSPKENDNKPGGTPPIKGGGKTKTIKREVDLIEVTFIPTDTSLLKVDENEYRVLKGAAKTVKLNAGFHKLIFESLETGLTLKPTFYLNKDSVKNGKYVYPVTFRHNVSRTGKPALKDSLQNSGAKPAGSNNGSSTQDASLAKGGSEKEKATVAKLAEDMVFIAGGSFDMESEKVAITPFRIGKYEVTQQQWEAIMRYNNSGNKGCSSCPVENVSWKEVDSFTRKINSISTKRFRLPTEAEWEYVAKQGFETAAGNASKSKEDQNKVKGFLESTAWYKDNAKNTHPVGEKRPAYGIYDMFGNVAEWCTDVSADTKSKGLNNLLGLGARDKKVVKGGSYKNGDDYLRPLSKDKENASAQEKTIGFRLVLEAE